MVSVAWFTAGTPGWTPTATDGGALPQPVRTVALHVAPSITETVLSFTLATYTVSVAWSTAASTGPGPTVTAGGACPQPEAMVALQVAVLITETVLSLPFPTYAVWVAWS